MGLHKGFALWPIAPFGAESDDGGDGGTVVVPNQEGIAAQSNPPAGGSVGKPAQATLEDGDDDGDFKDLTPRELRRIARDLAEKAKSIESERDSFKAKVDEQERKTRTNEENLQKDLELERQSNASLRATNARLAILGAIRDDSRYEWHDAEMVAQQLNPEIVRVSENGSVEGLRKELDRIAKEHEFLLKRSAGSKGRQQDTGRQPNGPTGFQPGQGGANNNGVGGPDIKELAKSYPALVSRVV